MDALIEMLDTQYPLKNFPLNTSEVAIHRHLGARDIVDFLRSLQRERDEAARR